MSEDPGRLSDALKAHYQIEHALGRGGMATVYLAQDLKHDRRVALKVMNLEVARSIGQGRFLREIATTARLSHPHILPLLDSGDAAGFLYYVMPLVPGGSLRERIAREGTLPLEDAVRITREVADALTHAHEHGIVHRDIKPDNILISGGHVVVADFGIARAAAIATDTTLTASGVTVGTPQYMSPEQVSGGSIDGRSDLYSLGCVLYEMLTGRAPFEGQMQDLVYQHLSAEPRPVSELRRDVPAHVAAIVAKLLAKSPGGRYSSANDLIQALDGTHATAETAALPTAEMDAPRVSVHRYRWALVLLPLVVAAGAAGAWRAGWLPDSDTRAAAAAEQTWLLVADFESPDSALAADTKYFVSSALEGSPSLAIIPRSQIVEALHNMGRPLNTRLDASLSRQLALRGELPLLEGQVVRAGKRYLISVRVSHVEEESTRVLSRVTATADSEDELITAARTIGARVRRDLGERMRDIEKTQRLSIFATSSFEAAMRYRAAARALAARDDATALRVLREVLGLDPRFAYAWVSMGYAYHNLDKRDSSLICMKKALAIPDALQRSTRLAVEAMAADLSSDLSASLTFYDQAVELNHAWLNNRGVTKTRMGRFEDALSDFEELAKKQSVFGPSVLTLDNIWETNMALGRWDRADSARSLMRATSARRAVAWQALATSRLPEAERRGMEILKDAAEMDWVRWEAGLVAASALMAQGSTTDARRTLQTVRNELPGAHGLEIRYSLLLLDLLAAAEEPSGAAVGASPAPPEQGPFAALREAAFGDTSRARRMHRSAMPRPATREERFLLWTFERMQEWRAGRGEELIRALEAPALTGLFEGQLLPAGALSLVRWLRADALGRQGDLAAARAGYELGLQRSGYYYEIGPRSMLQPYILQRLVLLDARAGRIAEARRLFDQLSAQVTKPDPAFRPGLEEARQTLLTASGIASPSPREIGR